MKYVIAVLTLFLSLPSLAQIIPDSQMIEQNSGVIMGGNYDDNGKLESTYEHERYDEVVATFNSLEKGKYKYRLKRIPKSLIRLTFYQEFGGCAQNAVQNTLNLLKKSTQRDTSRMEVISSQPDKAEIRLTSPLPEKEYVITPHLLIGCSEPHAGSHVAWTAAQKPSTDWRQVTLNNKKTLVVRFPAKYQSAVLEFVKAD